MSQPNIEYMMNMTKDYLGGKIEGFAYCLDFPYELEKRYKSMRREDPDYSELIYECIYEDGEEAFTKRYEEKKDVNGILITYRLYKEAYAKN